MIFLYRKWVQNHPIHGKNLTKVGLKCILSPVLHLVTKVTIVPLPNRCHGVPPYLFRFGSILENLSEVLILKALIPKFLNRLGRQLTLTLFAAAVILLTGAAATHSASALCILTGAEDSAIVLDGKAPKLEQLPVQLQSLTGKDISFSKGQTVTVLRNGQISQTEVKNHTTLSTLLKQQDIALSPLEMVKVDVSGSAAAITIAEDLVYYDRVTEEIPYTTIRIPTPDLPKGTEQVVQKGVNGSRTAIYEVVWSNGKQISRQFVEDLGTTTVDEIIEYGTSADEISRSDRIVNEIRNEDGSGILEFASGVTLKFSGTKAMTATAYTAGHGGVDYTTATGTLVKVGVAAVDKRVIPLGTRMYVVTDDGIAYGLARAEDTGVRGNTIDLYHDTYQDCINFGRRSCTVYILE